MSQNSPNHPEDHKDEANQPNDQKSHEEQEEIEVVVRSKQPEMNQSQILKLYEQEEKAELDNIKKVRKQENKGLPIQKRGTLNEEEKKVVMKQESEAATLSVREQDLVRKMCLQYQIMYKPSIHDHELAKFRYSCKVEVFRNLLVAYFQIKKKNFQELNDHERRLPDNAYEHPINRNAVFQHCRKIVSQIDRVLLKQLNGNNHSSIDRYYRHQWQILTNNIKDTQNHQLGIRILSGVFNACQIVGANQIDFFTSARRKQTIERERRFIEQYTITKTEEIPPQEDENDYERNRFEIMKEKQKTNKEKMKSDNIYHHLEEESIAMIEMLLKEEHITKMGRRIEQDLKGPIQTKIADHFRKVLSN